jgi:hypothetical protein
MWDLTDLEVWQRLANLFDVDNHKWCRLKDGSVVEYYEFYHHYMDDGKYVFEKVKTPVEDYHNFAVCRFIPAESIEEDDINPEKL